MGGHRELIQTYGGQHSVISGHLRFFTGETLDPRYQYVTCLRDPVDRVLSWLSFVLYDSILDERSKPIKEAAQVFFESEGRECPDNLITDYSNFYVNHFAAIGYRKWPAVNVAKMSQDQKLAAALRGIRQYELVGIYEDFRGFATDLANLIGIETPRNIRKVNVSTRRPPISSALRQRIIELNEHDARLYAEVIKWKGEKAPTRSGPRSFLGRLKVGRNNRKTLVSPADSGLSHNVKWGKYKPEETLLTAAFGTLSVESAVSPMTIGQRKVLRVIIKNCGFQRWNCGPRFTLNASYHWLRASGKTYEYEGMRTPLPAEPLDAGASVAVDMTVVAPRHPGLYTLVATVIQDQGSWLERRGFTPAIITVVVKTPEAPA
jgi:hypothetical protein